MRRGALAGNDRWRESVTWPAAMASNGRGVRPEFADHCKLPSRHEFAPRGPTLDGPGPKDAIDLQRRFVPQ